MTLLGRIGRFIFFLSLIALIIFFSTVSADEPQFLYCFGGLIGLALGILFMARGRIPQQPSRRFRMLRSERDKLSEDKKEMDNQG